MAKKAKKAKRTEEEKQHLEQRFQEVRDQTLRQWYEQADDNDLLVRNAAQARLYLQLGLREKRREVVIRKEERDASKVDGDTSRFETARKKLKDAQYATAMHARMLRDGIPASKVEKSCRKWAQKTHSLEEVLADRVLDKKMEFGMSYDTMLDTVIEEHENGGILLEKDLGDMQLEDKDSGIMLEDTHGSSDSELPKPAANSIWQQHALHMQRRYRENNLPDYAMETKLAFQKKIFDHHVDREHQLCKAVESTATLGENSQYPIREGISLSYNTVLATTTYFEHSLWELTSPMLWRYFEGGLSWDYPQWIPRGHMRIQTVSSSSHIYFEFGARSFSTKRITIPSTIGIRTLIFPVQGHHDWHDIEMEITFFAQGFVKVLFPLIATVPSDIGYPIQPIATVELTGFWMGSVG